RRGPRDRFSTRRGRRQDRGAGRGLDPTGHAAGEESFARRTRSPPREAGSPCRVPFVTDRGTPSRSTIALTRGTREASPSVVEEALHYAIEAAVAAGSTRVAGCPAAIL